jgi:hypothetical protein
MLSIIKMNTMPPKGYYYEQPGTGMKFSGNERFKGQCMMILAHRKGNALPRATYNEVAQDLMAFTCARMPALCGANTPAAGNSLPRSVRRCGSCGGRKASV